jgi:type I restriction enzyme, R subunit
MNVSGHSELAFESAIEYGLITGDRYYKRTPETFDPVSALFPEDVISFLRVTPSAPWSQLGAMLKDPTAATVIDSLMKELQ